MTHLTLSPNLVFCPDASLKQIWLRPRQAATLGTAPMCITVLSGRVWITRSGGLDDTFIQEGEVFDASQPGLLVVQALPEGEAETLIIVSR
ncbi:MAG: DUF2917 domain-containing protein [Chloroflexi bacterium]|nr:DUF2917 domain-containing protein [Chloroflexota bacterium]